VKQKHRSCGRRRGPRTDANPAATLHGRDLPAVCTVQPLLLVAASIPSRERPDPAERMPQSKTSPSTKPPIRADAASTGALAMARRRLPCHGSTPIPAPSACRGAAPRWLAEPGELRRTRSSSSLPPMDATDGEVAGFGFTAGGPRGGVS